ncbi:MAG: hypothetical protein LBD54_01910 [Puniceicoccales bacterium]|nr:hypothetical protein [Puniceicoccales bacterium]
MSAITFSSLVQSGSILGVYPLMSTLNRLVGISDTILTLGCWITRLVPDRLRKFQESIHFFREPLNKDSHFGKML